ncbi:MAG: hypothetical protein FD143_1908 [Ignavibacteria bacterium]|nr:MAG: hypothetical protein FD143_1908 [Ignavibacteria bacterium]KAF0159937.1 MAG: hypothetical protein FD188_2062 [Ignavibacteria bacterium]
MQPISLKVREKKFLQINWDDNSASAVKLSNLRRMCPCALCAADKKNESSTYVPIYSDEQLKVNSIQIVGTYAIGIYWGDGHNTGIYEFNFLKRISEQGALN